MSSSSPSPASESTQRPVLSQLVESIFSSAEDNNVMLAAIVSLVVVILFVFVLHLYARTSFHSLRPPPPPSSSFVLDIAALSGAASKGLDPAAIAAIPLFVSGGGAAADDAECVVCLTEFDGGEICRRLPKCGHEFHVECIDMWLGSHASCPICRAPAAMIPDGGSSSDADSAETAAIADRRDPRAAADGDGVVALAIEIDGDSTAGNSSAGNGCSSSSPTTSFGCSLKRMLSRNRSEHKVSPAASVVSAESTE